MSMAMEGVPTISATRSGCCTTRDACSGSSNAVGVNVTQHVPRGRLTRCPAREVVPWLRTYPVGADLGRRLRDRRRGLLAGDRAAGGGLSCSGRSIYATDLNEGSLAIARARAYPLESVRIVRGDYIRAGGRGSLVRLLHRVRRRGAIRPQPARQRDLGAPQPGHRRLVQRVPPDPLRQRAHLLPPVASGASVTGCSTTASSALASSALGKARVAAVLPASATGSHAGAGRGGTCPQGAMMKVRRAPASLKVVADRGHRRHILIVDDDPTKRFALRSVLDPLGENIVEARVGRRRAAPAAAAGVRRHPAGRAHADHGRLRDRPAHPPAAALGADADHLRHRARPGRDRHGPRLRARRGRLRLRAGRAGDPARQGRRCSSSCTARSRSCAATATSSRRSSRSGPPRSPRSTASSRRSATSSRTTCAPHW